MRHHAKFCADRSTIAEIWLSSIFSTWLSTAILELFLLVRITNEEYLVVVVNVQNLVGISAVVSIVCNF